MFETSKTNKIRPRSFFTKYLNGSILDIGAGDDLVVSNAKAFDIQDGDANNINQFIKLKFDTVYSSHCLEHMNNPQQALREWWNLVKIGGYMILVVPEEVLYEQGFWPPIFNRDHKARFTISKKTSKKNSLYNLCSEVKKLRQSEIIEVSIQDVDYDYSLCHDGNFSFNKAQALFAKISKKIQKFNFMYLNKIIYKIENFCFFKFQFPIDQTKRGALAQIQIIVRKKS